MRLFNLSFINYNVTQLWRYSLRSFSLNVSLWEFNKLSSTSVDPIIIYSNSDIDKLRIFTDNKGKAGIYQWKHLESGKIYIGSAINLTKRLKDYYSFYHLDRNKSMYICNALKHYGYSAFSLSIIEYINIQNLSKNETKKLILEREQYYINLLNPEYNLLKVAGSLLGYQHSEETIKKISGSNNHFFGKAHTLETKIKMSIAKGTTIYVYSNDGITLMNTFTSAREAAKFFNVEHGSILRNAKSGKLFQDKWILSTNVQSKL